jgi:hypothetical protein
VVRGIEPQRLRDSQSLRQHVSSRMAAVQARQSVVPCSAGLQPEAKPSPRRLPGYSKTCRAFLASEVAPATEHSHQGNRTLPTIAHLPPIAQSPSPVAGLFSFRVFFHFTPALLIRTPAPFPIGKPAPYRPGCPT